jgi:tetratricopeptide (TPR) repeat protein
VLFVLVLLIVLFRTLGSGSIKGIVFTFALLIVFFAAIAIMMSHGGTNLFARVLLPQGNASPYKRDFSFEKALVMQGRTAEALEAYESQMRMNPGDAELMAAAAELYVTSGQLERGAALFQDVRLVAGVADNHRIYASNRLVDIYLRKGPMHRLEKAQEELRYLVENFPGTQVAERSREALKRLA